MLVGCPGTGLTCALSFFEIHRDCGGLWPPRWCRPGTQPEELYSDTGTLTIWGRDTTHESIWVQCFDSVINGRMTRSQPRVQMAEPPVDGWLPGEACQSAAALLNAVDLIDGRP